MAFNGTGANVTTLNASNISSGTVATARLGSGTADNTTFLRGDSTYAVPGGTAVNVQTFTSSGTWTKPSTGTMVAVACIGGGGGGGRDAEDINRLGGLGSLPVFLIFNKTDLASTVSVTIGSGGAGGGYFSAGGSGGNTSFGAAAVSPGGTGGSSNDGATVRNATANTISAITPFTIYGGVGLSSRNTTTGAPTSNTGFTAAANGGSATSTTGQRENIFGSGGATASAAATGNGAGGACGRVSSGNGGAGSAGICRVITW